MRVLDRSRRAVAQGSTISGGTCRVVVVEARGRDDTLALKRDPTK